MRGFAVAAALPVLAAGAGVHVRHDDPVVQYLGRFDHSDGGARYDMSGCEIRVRVHGAQRVTLRLAQAMGTPGNAAGDADEPQRNEFAVFVDGALQPPPRGSLCRGCTFDTFSAGNGTVEVYVAAKDLPTGQHDIRVVKLTEAQWSDRFDQPNWVTFHGFELDAGRAVPPLRSLPHRRIEFIGDSTLSGYCITCLGPMGPEGIQLHKMYVDWTADAYWKAQLQSGASGEDYLRTWPAKACSALGAQCHSTAWSGLGVTSECCGGDVTMPDVWGRSVMTDPASSWEFSQWVPDALVINIGMNDGMLVNTTKWLNAYANLVTNATAHYGEQLDVFLACGPITGRYCAGTQRVIDRVRAAGVKAHFLDQRPFLNGSYGGACCGHPSPQVSDAMAEAATAAISATLGWVKVEQLGDGGDSIFSSLDNSDGPLAFTTYECDGPHCNRGLLEMLSPEHSLRMNEL